MERVTSHPIANAGQSLKFFSLEDSGLPQLYDILINHSLKKDLFSNAIFNPCTLLLDNTFIYVYSKNIQKQAIYGEQAIVSILLGVCAILLRLYTSTECLKRIYTSPGPNLQIYTI
jgi:hypothetical protein